MNNYNSLYYKIARTAVPAKYGTTGHILLYLGAVPDEQRTKRSLQKYDLSRKKL